MQIVIIGASGFIGSALTTEALQRGHQVRALVRDTGKLAALQQQYPQQLEVISVDGRVTQVVKLSDTPEKASGDADAIRVAKWTHFGIPLDAPKAA